jgi:hypothetical protein
MRRTPDYHTSTVEPHQRAFRDRGSTERELEMPRHKPGVIKAGPPQPFAQIGADCGNAIKPDALDGRSKVVVVPLGDIGNDGIDLLVNSIQVACPHRKQSFSPKPGEKLELDVMDQRTALQWIDLVDRLRL